MTIDSPDHFAIQDQRIRIIIRSKYTYGKNVRGKAIVSIDVTSLYETDESNFVVIKTVPINGKASVEFDLEREVRVKFRKYITEQAYNLRAMVVEEFTGRTNINHYNLIFITSYNKLKMCLLN